MNVRFSLVGAALAAGLALGLLGCGHNNSGGSGSISASNIPLNYTPTEPIDLNKVAGQIPADLKISLTVTDDRMNKDTIGQNPENNPPIPYRTTGSPAAFVQKNLVKELSTAGLSVQDTPAGAARTFDISLKKFECEIHGLFHTDVVAAIEIKDASGASLWKGTLVGHDEHFGRNDNLENVTESLSNGVRKLAEAILLNPGIQKALH